MKNLLTVLLLAIALPVAASEEPKKPAEFNGQATMCDTKYALCIKAPCEKKPYPYNNKLYTTCGCIMQSGWNMGPNTCEERRQTLTSTYSNNFNDGSATLSCPAQTPWAWCYGATCEPDPYDPNKAICKCPVLTKDTVILVSWDKCADKSSVCGMLWSGALPGESKFANEYYAWWMKKHGFQSEPPAKECPAPPAE